MLMEQLAHKDQPEPQELPVQPEHKDLQEHKAQWEFLVLMELMEQ